MKTILWTLKLDNFLQQIFSHSSTQVTAKYIGILDNEIEDMYNSIELGLDLI